MNSKVFDSGLLHVCLLDLVRKPSWSIGWLINHGDASGEDVDSFCSTPTSAYVRVSAGCSFKGRSTGLFASKNLARIFSVLHENKVFFIRHFGLPPIPLLSARYIVFLPNKGNTALYKGRSTPFRSVFFSNYNAVQRLCFRQSRL